jgi:isoquinoline 1-oxidoreductase beta subunit
MRLTRRDWLKWAGLAGTALVLEALPGGRIVHALAAAPPRARRKGAAGRSTGFAPNPWIVIAPDDRVTIVVARGEMGQGVRTSLPMIVAEALDCDWARVDVVNAEPGPDYSQMRTSGSWSVGGGWAPLLAAGAMARDLLVRAAAQEWGVESATCTTASGEVVHQATGRRVRYGALVATARTLPPAHDVEPSRARAYRLVGQRMKRRDGPDIVRGRATYGIDLRVPGMLFASVERGPWLGARVVALDAMKAKAVPGVRAVVRVPSGVAVVARDSWTAQQARAALAIDWAAPAGERFSSAEFERTLGERSREAGFEARNDGDVAAALAAAAPGARAEAVYEYGFQAHAPLEPPNAVAHARPGACDVWVGTQAANQVQEAVAQRLGLAPAAVRVHPQLMGGGFGRRLGLDFVLEAVEISRAAGAPVQVLWSRGDDLRYGFYQPASAHRMAGAIDARGRVVAWRHTMAGVPHSAFHVPPPGSPDLARDLMWGGYDNPYRVPNMRVAHVTLPPPVPTGPWRAVHYPPGVFARECFLDELAHLAGRDPVELRLELLDGPPSPLRDRLRRVIQVAADGAGWREPRAMGRGLGIAANVYDGDTVLAQVAEVSRPAGGPVRVHRVVCAVDCGTVVNPLGLEGQVESAIVWGLTAALKGRITFADGLAEQGSFVDYPVLAMAEMPRVDVHIVPSAGPPLGIGEQCVSPVAAAVNNALFAATGVRERRSPVPAGPSGADPGR